MKRSEKPFLVEDLAERIKDAKSIAVVDYQGLPIREQEKLRQDLAKVGGQFQVVKNTLLKRAFESAKVKDGLPRDEVLRGPTAVVFSNEDELAPLQLVGKLIKAAGFPKLKFGIFGGDVLDSEKLLTLAQLPAKNVLFGQLVGVLSAPLYQFVGALQFNTQRLVYTLNAKSKMVNGGD
ncbi:MAG: 50S ribosomal protein L10 [bacterium]|nr:50S ribosomal protein L10 [bacterium]